MCSKFNVTTTLETGHEDMIHDAQMDFLGSKLATCSCDKSIRIFDINLQTGGQAFICELKAHEGPVWQLAWAHPRFGNLLASCSYDRRVIIWKEENDKWEIFHTYDGHDSSVNSVCWAPHEWGLTLACGSSDSSITVLAFTNDRWTSTKISNAHTLGCNAVSWSPVSYPSSSAAASSIGAGDSATTIIKRFASGGCDNLVKIWKEENDQWVEEAKLEGHADWVRDVAWAPLGGKLSHKIASSSQDRRVIIWNNTELNGYNWAPEPLHVFDDVVWHVSWNFVGEVLAVSGGDNQVSLWKKNKNNVWDCISDGSKANQQPGIG